jgi:hypothetical protein
MKSLSATDPTLVRISDGKMTYVSSLRDLNATRWKGFGDEPPDVSSPMSDRPPVVTDTRSRVSKNRSLIVTDRRRYRSNVRLALEGSVPSLRRLHSSCPESGREGRKPILDSEERAALEKCEAQFAAKTCDENSRILRTVSFATFPGF